MSPASIRLGLLVPAKPPIGNAKLAIRLARLTGLHNAAVWDHYQDFIPQSLWTEENTWMARDTPWAHEHYEFQVLLGYLAGVAGNLRIGVGVTEPLRRHPVLIAQAMMTLSHLTKQPPILGMGAGERENTEPYGIPFTNNVGKLEEALEIIRICFTSRGPFDYEGKYFQLKDAVLDLVPADGKAPSIWVAAHGPRMLQLTGRFGDGWYPGAMTHADDYGDRWQVVRRHAREAGRDPDQIVPSLQLPIVLAPSDDEARTLLNTKLAKFMTLIYSDDAFQRIGMTHPLGQGFRGFTDILPESLSAEQLERAADQITPDILEELIVWGSPDRIAQQIFALGDAGLRHVDVSPVSVAVSEKLQRYLPRGLWSLRRKLQ